MLNRPLSFLYPWPGEQALALGSAGHVTREIIGEEKTVNYSLQPSALEKLSKLLGANAAEGLMNYLNTQQHMQGPTL